MLKDGSEVLDYRMDRLYELDLQSLNYALPNKPELSRDFKTYSPRSFTWATGIEVLDQGPDGACVGFAYAHDLPSKPQVITEVQGAPVDAKFAKEKVYWPSQETDDWPGGSYPNAIPFYEGTSILAGAKTMQSLGFYESYYWGLNLQQMVIGVCYDGPCIIGVNMYQGMCVPDTNGFVQVIGSVVGGHAMLVYGVKIVWKSWVNWYVSRKWENVNLDASYFKIKNSWGPQFGLNGTIHLPFRGPSGGMERLIFEQGDVCFPKRRPI